jgi:hypothetical protein
MMRGFIDGEYQDGDVRGRVFVCGASGYGKTTEVLRLISQCQGGALFFDTTGRHSIQGAVYVHEPGELKKQLLRVMNKRFRIVYQPMGGDLTAHFRAACKVVDAVAGMVFAVDEIDSFCGPEWGDSRVPPELYKLVHFGRHCGRAWGEKRHGIAMVYTARIPTSVARALTSQAYEMRLFHEHESSYVRYFAKGPIGKDNAQRLIGLKHYAFFVWRNDGQPMRLSGGKRTKL